jgi:DNA-binding GntR family transcriptional regulator
MERTDIVSRAAEQVRRLIVGGELCGGARINETHLSRRLGVSRTPVREALRRLAGEGAVVSIPNLGFFVTEMSAAELDEVYLLRPLLDVLALRMGGPPSATELGKMKRINAALDQSRSAAAAVDLDNQWHRLLLSRCANALLLDFIDKLIDRTRRYELLLFEDPGQRVAAATQHAEVMEALETGDPDRACAALAGNLTRGDAPLRSAVSARSRQFA